MKVSKRLVMLLAATLIVGMVIGRGCAGSRNSDAGHDEGGAGEAAVRFWLKSTIHECMNAFNA